MDVSHPDRVVFPVPEITKGEVVAYYEMVATSMLPFVKGRALTVERYPKGMASKGFMQKNAPDHFPSELIGRHEVPKEDGGTTTYAVIDGVDAIPAFVNLGVITFHAPPGTVQREMESDWIIWDLDPTPGEFEVARASARSLRQTLESFDISTLLMTSGSNGYHLRAEIEPRLGSSEAARIARGTAALAAAAEPDLMTLAFRKKERGSRVFIDWLRNAPYSTSVVPWSLRARENAPVATPISWEELDVVDPDGVELNQVKGRLEHVPWDLRAQDLRGVAERVESALAEAGIELEPFDRFRS